MAVGGDRRAKVLHLLQRLVLLIADDDDLAACPGSKLILSQAQHIGKIARRNPAGGAIEVQLQQRRPDVGLHDGLHQPVVLVRAGCLLAPHPGTLN